VKNLLLLGLAAGIALLAGARPADAALLHQFDSYLGGSMATPESVAVDEASGDLYVLERGSGCLSRFHGERGGPNALQPHDFPATGTNQICGLELRETPANAQVAVDNSGTATQGTIYVNSPLRSEGVGATLIYDPEGNLEGELTQVFDIVCGVATDPSGNVFVGERYGGVLRYRRDEPVTEADYEGNLYEGPACLVAYDSLGNRYGSWEPNGPLIKTGSLFRDVSYAIALDPASDDLYVSEGTEVSGISSDGVEFDRFGSGEVDEARGMAIDTSNGVAYVADAANGRVAVYQGSPAYRLDVDFTGTGLGAVSADQAPIEDCGDEGQCAGYYGPSTVVLEATPQPHSVIDGWTGCDDVSAGGEECTIEITNANRKVFANFTRLRQTVSAATAGTGSGTVSDVDGLGAIQECGGGAGQCSGFYDEGSAIELVATPTGHSSFTGWSGDCSNQTGPCELVIEGEPSVTAHFAAQHAVSVRKEGTGAGSVVSEPAGLSCGGVCVGFFTEDEQVTLSAVPSGDSTFIGWSGAGCSGTGTCVVQASGPLQSVVANFAHFAPLAVTEPGATFVGQHVATVHGAVNPRGAVVSSCLVEYGPSPSYGATAPCSPSAVGAGDSFVPIGVNLVGLAAATTYHYRLSASGIGGTARGDDQTVRTLADTCDTDEALCPAARSEPQRRSCKKGRVLKKGRCVKKRHHGARHRHRKGHR
jgi:Divergent InlB B-repeat domain